MMTPQNWLAVIFNGSPITLTVEKWHGRITTRMLHALTVHCLRRNWVTLIQICLANLPSKYIVNTREKTSNIMPILTIADEVHGMIECMNHLMMKMTQV